MGNLIPFSCLILLSVLVSSCARHLDRAKPKEFEKQQKLRVERIEGQYLSIDGITKNFESQSGPLVLFLVSDSCSVCRSEALALSSDFSQSGLPRNVRLVSLLIGAVTADAVDWRDELNVQWEVGVDLENTIFNAYCPEKRTPCVLVQNEGKVTKFLGETGRTQLEKLTGEWRTND